MGGEWIETTLGDVVTLKRGYDLPAQNRVSGHVPIVSSSGITGRHNAAKAKAPGIVTGRYGTLGKVHYITEDYWPLNTTLYVQNFKDNDPRFIAYFLRGIDFLSFSDKSSVPGLNRNHLHAARIRIPHKVSEQSAIAEVLRSLDDKIELNRRMNRALEKMAREIFKAWFIDFEPVKAKARGASGFPGMPQEVFEQLPKRFTETEIGSVPKRWPIQAIADVAEYVNGRAFTKQANGKGRMVIRIAELKSGPGGATKYSDIETVVEYMAFPDDILFAWSGSLDVYRWHRDEALINQHIFKVIPKDYPKWYIYYRLVDAMPFFQSIASTMATTMGHIKRGHLSDALYAQPPAWLIATAENRIQPLYDLIHCNEKEILALTNTRDTLLPKLISGELRIPNADAEARIESVR